MRTAVLSDIHGNAPALQAVLTDALGQGAERFLVAGDLFTGAPFPRQVLDLLLPLDAVVIQGNGEGYLVQYDQGTDANGFSTSPQWELLRWTHAQIGPAGMDYLSALPEQRMVETPGLLPVRLLHGSPARANEGLVPDGLPDVLALYHRASLWPQGEPPPSLARMLDGIGEPVVICGHTHIPWHQRAEGRLVVNPGSVGISNNGSPHACYALLDPVPGGWQASLRSVQYDVAPVLAAFSAEGLLEASGGFGRACLENIRTGENVSWLYIRHCTAVAHGRGEDPQSGFTRDAMRIAEYTFPWESYL